MQSTVEKSGLPGWAKVLMGIGLFFLIAFVVLVGACSVFFGEFRKKNTDPVVVQKIANTIVTIDEPLPAGFKWVVGLDIFNLRMAAVNHTPDNLELILTSLPSSKSATTLEENISSSEVNPALANATGTQSKFEARVKGSESVANKKFIYAIGIVKDRKGRALPSLMGFFSPNDQDRSIMLIGVQEGGMKSNPSGVTPSKSTVPAPDKNLSNPAKAVDSADLVKAYNLEATKQFLHAIKKI